MTETWQPACDLQHLRLRAQMLSTIRQFFVSKAVLEVETPLLCSATGTDPQLDFFSTLYHAAPHHKRLYLQTSPEFAMKRLLASGSGCIFQICKAFRNNELGRFHNPEFTILEWYRVNFNLSQLMDETAELIQLILANHGISKPVQTISYQDLFQQTTGLNPLIFDRQQYDLYAQNQQLHDATSLCKDDHSLWLDFIFSTQIQPQLKKNHLYLVHSYPAIQASLARINPDNSKVADRFEVFIDGIEIGNAFHELANAEEQQQRFDKENTLRALNQQTIIKKDQLFLKALQAGLPNCSGIAIGLDRLLMIISQASSLDEVIAFPFDRA